MNPQLAWNITARDKSAAAFQSFDRRVVKSDNGVRRLATSMEAVGAVRNNIAAAAAALAGLGASVAAVRGVVSEMSRLAKDADKVGLLTDEFQRLQFGFELAGVEAAAFTKGMEQFNKRLTEAQTGTGNLKKILDANNVSLFNADGSMKSVNRLLAEYAGLIENAETSQNKLYLATEAFGRSGGDFVLAMRNGADGVRELMLEADNAGGVIDEELLRKAEEVDDAWTRVARTFEIKWKSSILSVVSLFDEMTNAAISFESNLSDALGNVGNADVFKWLNEKLGTGDTAFVPGEGVYTGAEGAAIKRSQDNSAYEAMLNSGLGHYPTSPVTPLETIIFSSSGGGGRSGGGSSASKTTISDAQKVIDALTEELEILGLSEEQQRVVQELRRAGVDAASAEGQAIIGLVGAITQEEAALKALADEHAAFADAMNTLADYGIQAFDIWISGAEDMEEQLKRLGVQLLKLAAQALLLGEGPLAGLFGTVGGGLFGGFGGGGGQLAGAMSGQFVGLFDRGGHIGAGQWGIAGEGGAPEVVTGPARVTPMARLPLAASGRQGAESVAVDVRTTVDVSVNDKGELRAMAHTAAEKVSERKLRHYDRQVLPKRMKDISANPRKVG